MSVSARMKQYGILRAIGMDERQIVRMVAAEAFTYGLSGTLVGSVLGLPLYRVLFTMLITHYFGAACTTPWLCFIIIIGIVLGAVILAIHTPFKRILNIPITATINEL